MIVNLRVLFLLLLFCSRVAYSGEKPVPLNRYGSIESHGTVMGINQSVEKYIKTDPPTLRDLILEILNGTGLSLCETRNQDLIIRLNQQASYAAYVQHGEIWRVLLSLMDGYQLIYDPIHSWIEFRVKPMWNPMLARG